MRSVPECESRQDYERHNAVQGLFHFLQRCLHLVACHLDGVQRLLPPPVGEKRRILGRGGAEVLEAALCSLHEFVLVDAGARGNR
jgi:hypothetical protein